MTQLSSRYSPSRRAVLAGAAALATASILPRSAEAAAPLKELLGAFKYAGGHEERQRLNAAIRHAVSGLSVLVRRVARGRLERANPVPERLALAADKRSFMLAYDAELYAAPLDGTAVKVRSSLGEDMTLRVRVTSRGIEQIFATEGKSRTNVLAVDAGKLVVDVTVRASELPKALAYRLTYTRG